MLSLILVDGAARLVRVDGERFTMVAERAFAPGTPVTARIEGEQEAIELKVTRSVRRSDGAFDVAGRLVNVTRALRLLLDARMAPSSIRRAGDP